jgi:predicted DNA-binding transcriptional regulator AlpA
MATNKAASRKRSAAQPQVAAALPPIESPNYTTSMAGMPQPVGGVCFLSKRQVCDKVNLSPHYVWRLICAGKFPEGRVMGRRTLWISSEVEAWILSQTEKRTYRKSAEVA